MSRSPAAAFAAVLLPFAGYALILTLPQSGMLGMALRYNLDLRLLLVFGLLWLALLPKGHLGTLTGLAATLGLFALPLAGLWASAAGEMHVLGGLVYFSDTAGFYWDANRLLEGSLFSAFAARRPIFAGLLAGLLGISNHHLQLALAVLVALCAVCCFLAARELRQTHGAAAGALMLLLLFLFYRRFIGMTDTENLGLALGAAGFASLWHGARMERRLDLLAGTLLLTLALATRAGAFLVLPALVLWGGWQCRSLFSPPMRSRGREILTAAVMLIEVIAFGFVLNLGMFKATTDGQGSPFANSAYTLYGMAAGGKGWMQIYQDAPELTRLPEARAAQEINTLALDLIRENPGRFAKTVLGQFADFFSLRDESVFGFASGADVVIFDAPRPENMLTNRIVRVLLYALSLLGLYHAVRQRGDAPHSLLLFLVSGMVLSVAFLPPQDAGLMRIYAATLPILTAVPAIGLSVLSRSVGRLRFLHQEDRISSEELGGRAQTVFGLTLAGLVVAAPLTVRLFAKPPVLPERAACLPGEESVSARISPGAYLQLVADEAAPRTWLPEVQVSDFRASLQSFPYQEELAGLETIQAPALLQNAIDLETGRAFWLVLTGGRAPQGSQVISLCGNWNADLHQRNYDFFFGIRPEG